MVKFSRIRLFVFIITGAAMFMIAPLYFLSQAQALEFLQHNFPNAYALLISPKTIVALEIVGLLLLGTVLVELWIQRERKQSTNEQVAVTAREPQESRAAHASIGDININLNNPQTQSNQITNTASQNTTPAPASLIPQVDSMPRIAKVEWERQTVFIERQTGHRGYLAPAAIVRFIHQSKDAKKVAEVIARLEYKPCSRLGEYPDPLIKSACWLEHTENVDFVPGSVNDLILALFEGGEFFAIEDNGYDSSSHRDLRFAKLTQPEYDVTVTLISRYRGEVTTCVYRLLLQPELRLSRCT